jgi:EPS-associated MarR family transcriptional regulator
MNDQPTLPQSDEGVGLAGHLELLRLLEQHPDYSQRRLAVALGLSLGKTHYLLKALLGKGWVKAQNFQRSNHKLGYLYVLTPQGVRYRMQLTRLFLGRKEQEYEALRRQIVLLREELVTQAQVQLESQDFDMRVSQLVTPRSS